MNVIFPKLTSAANVVFRPLATGDLDSFRAHLLRLNKQDRYSRFEGSVADTVVADYAEYSLRTACSTAYGAFIDGALVGVGEVFFFGELPEIALSVDREFRRQGIGRRLMECVLQDAGKFGFDSITFHCLADNCGVRTLAKNFGVKFQFDGSELIGTIWTNQELERC